MTRPNFFHFLIAAPLLFAAGCKREQIRVYVVPADVPKEAAADAAHGAHGHDEPDDKSEGPQIAWKLPEGWRETEPTKFNFANFALPSATGGEAIASIAQMPDLKGREPMVVNMWREQVELGPMNEAEAAKVFTPVTVAGSPGQSFEVAGNREGKPWRIVTAILHRGEGSWFFKLAGDDATVAAHKAEFLDFAKTIRFVDAPPSTGQASAPSLAPAVPTAPPAEKPAPALKWSLPEGWKTLTAGQMQVAKFAVPEQNGAKAEVAVSIFPSDTGGNLANVNRWRSQLGLPPTDEAGLATCTQPLDGGGTLIDLVNEQRQLVGAIIPRDGRWWFYKMLGDTPAVTAAKDAFVQFIKIAP
jgi:hypothetical protein